MKTLEISKRLVSPELKNDQISITEIPRMLYSHFYKKKISAEIKTETIGEIRLWCELPTKTGSQQVILIFTEEYDDDAVKTKFALSTWYPSEEEYRDQYDFEIFSLPTSQGWNHGEGSRFVESISLKTKSTNLSSIDANHEIVNYMAEALIEMKKILARLAEKIVYREFVDGSSRPPR